LLPENAIGSSDLAPVPQQSESTLEASSHTAQILVSGTEESDIDAAHPTDTNFAEQQADVTRVAVSQAINIDNATEAHDHVGMKMVTTDDAATQLAPVPTPTPVVDDQPPSRQQESMSGVSQPSVIPAPGADTDIDATATLAGNNTATTTASVATEQMLSQGSDTTVTHSTELSHVAVSATVTLVGGKSSSSVSSAVAIGASGEMTRAQSSNSISVDANEQQSGSQSHHSSEAPSGTLGQTQDVSSLQPSEAVEPAILTAASTQVPAEAAPPTAAVNMTSSSVASTDAASSKLDYSSVCAADRDSTASTEVAPMDVATPAVNVLGQLPSSDTSSFDPDRTATAAESSAHPVVEPTDGGHDANLSEGVTTTQTTETAVAEPTAFIALSTSSAAGSRASDDVADAVVATAVPVPIPISILLSESVAASELVMQRTPATADSVQEDDETRTSSVNDNNVIETQQKQTPPTATSSGTVADIQSGRAAVASGETTATSVPVDVTTSFTPVKMEAAPSSLEPIMVETVQSDGATPTDVQQAANAMPLPSSVSKSNESTHNSGAAATATDVVTTASATAGSAVPEPVVAMDTMHASTSISAQPTSSTTIHTSSEQITTSGQKGIAPVQPSATSGTSASNQELERLYLLLSSSDIVSKLWEVDDTDGAAPPPLTKQSLQRLLDAIGGHATLIGAFLPSLIAAHRRFASIEEFESWLNYARRRREQSRTPAYHHDNPRLFPALRTMLDNPSCALLRSVEERAALYDGSDGQLDSLVSASGGPKQLLHHLNELARLRRSFESIMELSECIEGKLVTGSYLPEHILQKVMDGAEASNVFGSNQPGEVDGEALDTLLSRLRRASSMSSSPDGWESEIDLEEKVDLLLDQLRCLAEGGVTFASWPMLCATMMQTSAVANPNPSTQDIPTSAASTSVVSHGGAASATTTASTHSRPSATPTAVNSTAAFRAEPVAGNSATPPQSSSSLSSEQRQALASILSSESFTCFDNLPEDAELRITLDGLDALVQAAGPHGFDGAIQILTGLSNMRRSAHSFDHLIQMVAQVVEDGAYSSREERAAILEFLQDVSRCRLFAVGGSSDFSLDLLSQTPSSSVDTLLLLVGGSPALNDVLQHLLRLDGVGARFDAFEDLPQALMYAWDPQQGNGSYVGAKERKELLDILQSPTCATLLPSSLRTNRSELEKSLRSAPAELDSLFATATATVNLLQSIHSHKGMSLFASMRGRMSFNINDHDEGSNLDDVAHTPMELIQECIQQINMQQSAPPSYASSPSSSSSSPSRSSSDSVPALPFQSVVAFLTAIEMKVADMKSAREVQHSRTLSMIKKLKR